ncbi:hypothetical protein GOV12_08305 [Candidatus Pacearchaeota archaeon]|nr:hypothetical protein [Candidatus Pacearchaeota archaeon]
MLESWEDIIDVDWPDIDGDNMSFGYFGNKTLEERRKRIQMLERSLEPKTPRSVQIKKYSRIAHGTYFVYELFRAILG